MTDRPSDPANNGVIEKARDEQQVKPSASSERPKSRNGEHANTSGSSPRLHVDRSSPASSHRNSPSPPSFRHPSDNMPVLAKPGPMSANNRPPSTTSVHSNNSGGATRTTATSRRGGRTRSRSPPAMSNRNSIASHDSRGFPTMSHAESDSNPSSAAAAAAAAAKALSNAAGGPPWSDRGSFRDDRHRGGGGSPGDEPTKFPSYDNHYQGSRSWPPEEHDRHRRSGSYGHSQSIHRLPGGSGGGSGDMYGRHGPPPGSYEHYRGGGGERRPGSRMHPSYEDHHGEDRRYSERHSRRGPPGPYDPDMRKGGRSMSPSTDRYGQPYYPGGSVGMAPSDERKTPPKGPPSLSGGGGMSRVIGTATPIHVPRASEPPPSRHSRSGTPASVFRGRPGSEGPPSARRDDRAASEEDTPQKILLSLRTPSTSFDEKQPSKNLKDATDLPPSPDEPPQIQHSHHQHPADFFEPSRSPKSDSIEMAPSFNLFNQSFDSFGDTFNVVGGLDVSLQSASFGALGASASGEFLTGQGPLTRNPSGGNFTQQLLGGSASGGGLTFGMSPVNSFGNNGGPPKASSSRRGSEVMVLGGQGHRAASPTQVLGMYHSYSGGGSHGMLRNNSMGPLEDRDIRLSASSFGAAPSLSHNYTRSFGGESMMSYNGRMAHSHEAGEGGQLFYIFLRRHKAAFKDCTFLLPGLKAALLEAPAGKSGDLGDIDPMMKPSLSHGGMYPEPSPHDMNVARRRVTSAVCAFGGSPVNTGSSQQIFRDKEEAPTVTPSSSSGAPPGSRFQSRAKMKYDEVLPTRYYENENRLSWEFEENPPVDAYNSEESDETRKTEHNSKQEQTNSDGSPKEDNADKDDKKLKADDSSTPATPSTPSKGGGDNDDSSKAADSTTGSPQGDQPKMRYRCKLCGQPKQNHTCPFMQSLARSIGIMVYPSVNAFTAAEPGIVAPPLSEMNNFVGPDDGSVAETASRASMPTPDRRHLTGHGGQNGSTQVTPESSRRSKARQITSPTSTLSTGSSTPQRPRTPGSAGRNRPGSSTPRTPGSSGSRRSRKRRHGQMNGSPADGDQGDLLFVEAMELKQEQFRMVTPTKAASSPDAYTYAALPLPYAQRKRLSDNLFSLSQKVPQLTKECSAVLREAREKDMWDLAVAELMTQVVVVIHCHEGDARFDGLRKYLLTLGIAC